MIDMNKYRWDSPGDNAMRCPEIAATEQRIVKMADALLSWMRVEQTSIATHPEMIAFFSHSTPRNPGSSPEADEWDPNTRVCILDKLDPDANRFFIELLRTAYELRCWQRHYGLRTDA